MLLRGLFKKALPPLRQYSSFSVFQPSPYFTRTSHTISNLSRIAANQFSLGRHDDGIKTYLKVIEMTPCTKDENEKYQFILKILLKEGYVKKTPAGVEILKKDPKPSLGR